MLVHFTQTAESALTPSGESGEVSSHVTPPSEKVIAAESAGRMTLRESSGSDGHRRGFRSPIKDSAVLQPADGATALSMDSTAMRVILELEVPGKRPRYLPLEGGSCLLGSGEFCDIRLPDEHIPQAHSEIHLQGEVLWIEGLDEGWIMVNGQPCRRWALRENDLIQIGGCTLRVRINPPDELQQLPDFPEDLSELSALELCERVEAEQARVQAFEEKRLAGWEALLQQIEEVLRHEVPQSAEHEARLERALQQLHQLSDTLSEQAQFLAQREAAFAESASATLQEIQERIHNQLDRLLQQFQDGSLRASA